MTEERKTPKKAAPYIPFKTFTSFIERLHNTAVPPIIDGSVLQTMSGSMKSQLMSALRFMNLIDGAGTVNDKLRKLVTSYKTDSWKESLSEVIADSYNEVIGNVDLESGTAQQLNEAFRLRGGVDGQMLEKAVRFYLAAHTECGLSLSPHFTAKHARKYTPRKKAKKKAHKTKEEAENDETDFDIGFDESIQAKFRIPIPGKPDGIIVLPNDISRGDWKMVKTMLDAYVDHLTSDEENT